VTTGRSAEGGSMMRVAYVNIFVADLSRSVEFYRNLLGLDLQFSLKEHGFASFADVKASVGAIHF